MKPQIKEHIKRKMNIEKPTVLIGKSGTSTSTIKEVHKQLIKKGIIKVKILKSALRNEKVRDISLRIAHETESLLIEQRGHTFTLYKQKKSKKAFIKPLVI